MEHKFEMSHIYFHRNSNIFYVLKGGTHVTRTSIQFMWTISSVQLLSRVRLFATPWIVARQASLSITNSRSSLRLKSIESVMPSSHLILCRPLLFLPPIRPNSFKWVKSSHEVAKFLEFQLQHQSFQWTPRNDGLVGSPCSPRDSQESSPTPQFKSINSVLSFLHGPTLTSIHDHWKKPWLLLLSHFSHVRLCVTP